MRQNNFGGKHFPGLLKAFARRIKTTKRSCWENFMKAGEKPADPASIVQNLPGIIGGKLGRNVTGFVSGKVSRRFARYFYISIMNIFVTTGEFVEFQGSAISLW